ncbi:MAG: hypothetical protein R3D62_13975 [Xanthobacteraceae bacterium]
MKRLLLITAAATVLALPAAAQQPSSTTPSSSNPSAASKSSAQPSRTGSDKSQRVVSAQKVKQDLQKAGFQSVQVVDAAYLVHANTSDGDFVLLLIDPPGSPLASGSTSSQSGQQNQAASAPSSQQTQSGQSSQSSAQRHSGQQALKSNLEKAGYKNVTIVDASFLVHAKTADGSVVRMTINPPSMENAAETTGSGGASGSSSSPATPSKQR